MNANLTLDDNMISVGNRVLHNLRYSLSRDLGDRAPEYLQTAGFATAPQVYARFLKWLPEFTGVDDPEDLVSSSLGEVLSGFFSALGWGTLEIEQTGNGALALTTTDWAEAEPGSNAHQPSCYLSSGLFTDFLGRLSKVPVSVMEVECRSRGDERCLFIAGSPQTMEAVFEALAAGGSYESVLV